MTIPLITTLPLSEFVIVSSFSSIIPVDPVTSKLVLAVIVVKAPVDAELAPIAVLLIVPPDIVKSLSTFPSAIDVAFQVPVVIVPIDDKFVAEVSEAEFPVVITVPSTFGKVIVRSAVGSTAAKVVSYASSVVPSIIRVKSVEFPVVIKVPLTFGKVIVRSSVGSVTARLNSFSSALAPSKISGVPPDKVPILLAVTSVHDRVPLPLVFNT